MLSKTLVESQSIKLPRIFGARNLDAVFRVCEQVYMSLGPVILDGSETEFFDPLGIAVLGALLEPLFGQRSVRIEWLSVSVGTYLARMEVLSRCAIRGVESQSVVRNDLGDSLVELTRVSYDHEVDDAADRLATAVAGKLTREDPEAPPDEATGINQFEAFRYPLRYALSELLLNALSHAKREGRLDAVVWVAAQFYPKVGDVQLAVVDNGCGILETLRNSPALRVKTHESAIPVALKPFVSCNPDFGLPGGTANQGVGLTTTHQIAKATRGGLLIVSGDAAARAYKEVKSFGLAAGAHWRGVAVLMTCRRALLPSVNVPQLFPRVPNQPTVNVRFIP